MRLGLTASTYMYRMGYLPDRTAREFSLRGLPTPYFGASPTPLRPEERLDWLIDRCVEFGVPVCHAPITSWGDQAYLDRIKRRLEENKLELIPSVGANMVAGGDTTKRAVEAAIESLRNYRRFGGVTLSKFINNPILHSRFSTDPPFEEQIDRIVEHTRQVVKVAEECGIVLAFENHLDYRARDIVRIIETIGSPNLRFLFDTGNTLPICEDPVDAARDAAPYTVLVHLKDARVTPWTPGRSFVSAIFAAPLGRGHVKNREIVQILKEKAPDPDRLCLSLELLPTPTNEDEERWVAESIGWAKRELADHLG